MLEIAVLWFMSKEKELLLAQRSATKKFHPSEWGPTVTGTAEDGETPEQTLVREVEEELGLKSGVDYSPKFLFKVDFNHQDGRVRRFSIFYDIVEKNIVDKFKLDVDEVAGVKWLPMEKIKELLLVETNEFKMAIVPSAKDVWPKTFHMLSEKC